MPGMSLALAARRSTAGPRRGGTNSGGEREERVATSSNCHRGPPHRAAMIWIAGALASCALAFLWRLHRGQACERDRIATLLAGQTRVLEMIAIGKPLPDVLSALSRLIEQQASDMLCSILLLDGDQLRHGAAPSLAAEYCDAIDGVRIGPTVGSCGTAAYTRQPVVVPDVASDPLWKDFCHLALAQG